MKKKLSAYWWCQIVGWSIYVLITALFYLSINLFILNFLSPLILVAVIGVFITHIMRLFIIKTGLLKLNVFKQIIYILLTTFFFSFIYGFITVWLAGILQLKDEFEKLISLYSFKNVMSYPLLLSYSDSFFLGIWNLIYFSYHYVEKSRKEQIEKIRFENELKVEKLENEKTKIELQKEKTELEMQALRAQMNPHFIFNSLNSINRFILQNNKAQATEYLTKFSRLIRMILHNSETAAISLAEDLEALQLYLELESLRCEKQFSYKIECDPEIDKDFIQVPPMLLQPFVENAIWHGLMNKEGDGHLLINIEQEDSTLICIITDDGIGRKKAAELKDKSGKHKSMGMKITESRIAMMQKMNGENKSIKINDLIDADGSVAGTEVVLKIPMAQQV